MIRVLQIVDHMGLGGIQAFIMNVYRYIDRTKIQFDFLLHRHDGNTYANEIAQLGGIIYYVPARNQGILKNKRALNLFFKKHQYYQIVHQHESSLSYIEPLIAAKNSHVPIRIIHSHSTRMGNSMIHRFLHEVNARRIHRIATHYLACGELAGQWFYGKSKVKYNFTIVINGICLKNFQYNDANRKRMRDLLNVGDAIVYCHVGRFDVVKNHDFLIDVFKELANINPCSILVLVGDGVLMNHIKEKVASYGLNSKVMFLGFRNDINQIMQAADALILPSIYEGFPVTAIEAQAAGLPIFMSDSISDAALIKSNSYHLPLGKSPRYWARFISQRLERQIDNDIMYQKGFDIQSTVNILCRIYNKDNE